MRNSHILLAPLGWAVLYFLFGLASHGLNGAFIGGGYLWLPAGIVMGALWLTPTARWFALAVLLVAAQVLLGWLAQRELWRMLLFALDEVGVAALVLWWLRRSLSPLPLPSLGWAFARALLQAGALASGLSALLGATWLSATQDLPWWPLLCTGFVAELVGILVMTPLLASGGQLRSIHPARMERREFFLGLTAGVALLLSAWLAFGSGIGRAVFDLHFSLICLPLLCIVLVTLWWGAAGGALAVFVLTLIAFVCNSLGQGPFVALVQLHASNALLELQLYLAVAALLALLPSTLKTAREQQAEAAWRWQHQVSLALAASEQLAFTFDPRSRTFIWHGDVQQVLGCPVAQLARLEQVLARVAPLDQARLRQRWLDDIDDSAARQDMLLHLADGRQIIDTSRSLRDAGDRLAAVAGVWRCIGSPPP